MTDNGAREVFHGRYMSVLVDRRGIEVVHTDDEVLIAPITAEGRIILAIEPSAAFGEDVLVLPGGEVEAGESLEEAANRELQEEIGLRAGRLDFVGEVWPFSKYLRARSFIYVGRDLSQSNLDGDEGYPIQLLEIPLNSFEALIAGGRLRDCRAISSLYMARDFLNRER